MRKTPVVLGTLSIVFGAVIGALSAGTVFLGPLVSRLTEFTRNLPGQGPLQQAQMEATEAALQAQGPYLRGSSAAYVLLSAALVVIGVGLRHRQLWARRAARVWSVVGLVFLIANTVYAIEWVHPHTREVQRAVFAAHGLTTPIGLSSDAQTAMLLFFSLCYAAFPVVLLALLGRASALDDFSPAATGTPPQPT